MYQLVEASLADLTRLYQYKNANLFHADYSIKGFDYPWIVQARNWQAGEKVLDVGGGYSPLPIYLQQNCGVEMWVADDFGMKSNDLYWVRNASPQEYIERNSQIHFVLERLGDPVHSSLSVNSFDVVYSASVLEHVPPAAIPDVWKHMDLVLKPGGEMIHAVDVPFPSNGGVKKILMSLGLDNLHFVVPKSFKLKHFLATPKNFTRLACQSLGIKSFPGAGLSALRMSLDPDIVTESSSYGYKRIYKDSMRDYRYQRVGSLLLRMRKL